MKHHTQTFKLSSGLQCWNQVILICEGNCYNDNITKYNLIECSNNYAKTGSLRQYHKDDLNYSIIHSESLKFKAIMTGRTPAAGNIKDVEIMVPLKYLINFWRTLKESLINCKVSLMLTFQQIALLCFNRCKEHSK